MFRRSRYSQETEQLKIWSSFTDLISNLSMILSFFLILSLFKSLVLKSEMELKVQELESQVTLLKADNERVKDLEKLEAEIAKLKSAPPVLLIQNSGKYQFKSGSAVLPTALKTYIRKELSTEIEKITKAREIYIVEIIGHTDGEPINSYSNLDTNIENIANGKESIARLKPGSNADLGLMRALAVVKELQQTGKLKKVQFRAYSAGQLILTDGNFAKVDRSANATRRRIEIRFSPLGEAKTIK
ncbi:MAG: flagellar motor protein [Prochloraceae cyanobacterium]